MSKELPIHPTNLKFNILLFLSHQDGHWATWGPGIYMPTVHSVFPIGTEAKAQQRYMAKLQKQGLVGGCDCGCRGDYTLTLKGLEQLRDNCWSGKKAYERWIKREPYQSAPSFLNGCY